MVYTIELPPENGKSLHGKVVIDIEFWLNDCRDNNRGTLWYTECKTTIVPEGIVPLARSVTNPEELIKDLAHLIEYRRWLNEETSDKNCIGGMKVASARKDNYHHPELKKRIKEFCDKYSLICNMD